ncbi:acyl-CoA thioester hydrolase [Nocardioides albertanoniae]|uniref:Acyl-CoA thioester hydrolase n=1 Tax=Nocardioides albertanoniae TaxID=1175486 RepID=A0A543A8T5_9ACTN|nr:acyl-CoA thioesterase [Nocardioides albertanoniae]TQL69014.1 acyl-CoA thioester hydrolase [Nocardioides albertanoniae]
MRAVYEFTPRYLEIDQQGVMFNGWYLTYVDEAMNHFIEVCGVPYPRWEELGVDAQLAHADLDWKAGIGFGDRVQVPVRTSRIGTKSFTLEFEFRRGEEVACAVSVVYVVVAADGSGSTAIPPEIARAIG